MARRPLYNTAAKHAREEAALWRYIKSNHRLMLAEVKGDLWWTDSYVALKVDDRLVGVLAEFNLKPEPMVCTVGRTIKRTDTPAPDIAKLLPSIKGAKPVAPLTFGGSKPLLTEGDSGLVYELWSIDGKTVSHMFSRPIIGAATRLGTKLVAPTKGNPGLVVRVDDDGSPIGLAMSVHSSALGALPWGDDVPVGVAA